MAFFKGCYIVGAAGSRSLCNHQNCRTVVSDRQCGSDTAAEEVEEGMSLGEGSLKFLGKQRVQLVWEQSASLGEIREIGFNVVVMFECCMTEDRTCIILEQLEGTSRLGVQSSSTFFPCQDANE